MINNKLDQVMRESKNELLSDLDNRITGVDSIMKLAAVLTFSLYAIFNLNLHLGNPSGWVEYFTDISSIGGFIFWFLISIGLALFLARVKHAAYLHFGLFARIKLIVAVVITSALLAEFFTSSANQDAKSRITVLTDQAYQSTLSDGSKPVVFGNRLLTSDIATARRKLAQCQERLKVGREPHCKGSQATLNSFLESERKIMSAQKQVGTETLKLNHSRQDKLKADSYNAVFVATSKAIAAAVNGSYVDHIKTAVVLITLFMAVCFEILHHWLSGMRGQLVSARNQILLEIARLDDAESLKDRYSKSKQSTSEDDAEPEQKTEDEKQLFGFNKGGEKHAATAIENTPIKAGSDDGHLFKYQDRLKAEEAQKKKPETDKPGGNYERSGIGFLAGKNEARATLPHGQKKGLTGSQNPKLGTSELQTELPLDKLVDEAFQGGAGGQSDVPANRRPEVPAKTAPEVPAGGDLYSQWVEAVDAGKCRHSVDPTWSWIQKRVSNRETGKRTFDRTKISKMQKAFYVKAISEGRMKINPNFKRGLPKYLWSKEV